MAFGFDSEQFLSAKQKERRDRGADFQKEARLSWRQIPHVWRHHMREGGGTRPADDIVLTEVWNFLTEYKRTEGYVFDMDFLRPDQLVGLVNFDRVIPRNIGLVMVSFLNEEIDEAYAIHIKDLVKLVNLYHKKSFDIDFIRRAPSHFVELPRIDIDGQRGYDFSRLPKLPWEHVFIKLLAENR
jgi:hypothetical protein